MLRELAPPTTEESGNIIKDKFVPLLDPQSSIINLQSQFNHQTANPPTPGAGSLLRLLEYP